ncbi:hypothetical protein QR685DRAFT_597154 [Neurospora intermedia]|uniref:Uncharacterized protein n=1 Tax=Neurospora intermedia TaxID=5142 RepID=A0ABR3DCW8_NEUIN
MFSSSSDIPSSSSDANPSQSSPHSLPIIILFHSLATATATAVLGSTPNIEDDQEKEKEEKHMGGERKREQVAMERTTYVSQFKYVTSDVVDAEGRRGGIDFHDTQDENGVDDVGEKGEDADVGNTDDNDIVDYAGNESEMNEEYSDEDSMAMLETMRGKRRM